MLHRSHLLDFPRHFLGHSSECVRRIQRQVSRDEHVDGGAKAERELFFDGAKATLKILGRRATFWLVRTSERGNLWVKVAVNV